MLKMLATLGIVSVTTIAFAQTPLQWTTPMQVNATAGTDWPRVAISNSSAVMTWGDFASGSIHSRKFDSGNFTPEVQVTPSGFAATVSTFTGPDLKTSGDTVYVTYVDHAAKHAYLHHSYDGGNSFSDSIRIDNIGDDYPQYPTIDIIGGGNPILSFAQLSVGISDPQYILTKSLDGGNSFTPNVEVTESLGADPCDCCPGCIVSNGNTVCVIYRNAIDNIRDMRAAISHDGGASFNDVANIDDSGWILNTCPSVGGHGVIQGDTLITVYMNGQDGGNKCYVSTLDINTLGLGFKKQLLNVSSSGSQSHPRMTAKGDTMAVVWDQVIGSNRYIMFTYSLTGPAGLGETVDTISSVLTNGFHSNPDVAYDHGKFYVVFGDRVAQKIYLMESALYGTIGIENVSSSIPSIRISGNITGDAITISSNKSVNEHCMISIFNSSGVLCERFEMNNLQHTQTIKLDRSLTNGLYFVSVASSDFVVSEKMVVVR